MHLPHLITFPFLRPPSSSSYFSSTSSTSFSFSSCTSCNSSCTSFPHLGRTCMLSSSRSWGPIAPLSLLVLDLQLVSGDNHRLHLLPSPPHPSTLILTLAITLASAWSLSSRLHLLPPPSHNFLNSSSSLSTRSTCALPHRTKTFPRPLFRPTR